MTKNAPTVASTSATKTTVASLAVDSCSAVITDLHKHAVGERLLGVELVWPADRERTAHRAAVADDERRQRPLGDVGERSLHARGVLLERLAAGEAEAAGIKRERPLPRIRILALDVGD